MSDQPGTVTNCKFPGCDNDAATSSGKGRRPEYCTDPTHTAVNAWRERQRLDAVARGEAGAGAETPASETPVTMARISGAELLRQVRTEGGKFAATFERLLREAATLADPTLDDPFSLAELRTGAARLNEPVRTLRLASPFDYAAQSRCFVVTDVGREDPRQVAAAMRELFLAAGG